MRPVRVANRKCYAWAAAAAVATVVGVGVRWPTAIADAVADANADPAATTRPSSPDETASPGDVRRYHREGGFGGGFRWSGGRLNQPPNDADRAEAMAFMAQNAPRYAQWIIDLPDNDYRTSVENTVATAYASYQQLRPKNQQLYDVILRRIRVEDRIFGLRAEVRKATDDATRAKLESDVREQVAAVLELSLQERHLRLERLEQTVQSEKDTLAKDETKKSRSRMIDDRVARIMQGRGGGRGAGGPDVLDQPDAAHPPR